MESYLFLAGYLLTVMMLPALGKPVVRAPHPEKVEENSPEKRPEQTGLPYDQYLRQVVDVLESDPGFRKKLETANISDIKNGNIAMQLEMVNHTIRTVLDELKRKEVARLQELAHLQLQGTSGIDLIMNAMYRGKHEGVKNFEIPSHLDLKNPHSFEMSDLKNLILKTTADLEKLDKKRNEEFKEYEMEKEYEKKEHLRELSEQERKKEEARLEALKRRHADHPKLNHPGSKDQFEEVWEKGDHLEGQDFNPRTFFFTHDLNGDFEWDIEEVEALLQLELDKVYDSRNSPEEDDPLEREQEMNRMRQHIFQEMDKDKNFRITLNEFFEYTGPKGDQPQFEKSEGWKTIDEEPVFSEEEYQRFLESHHAQPDDSEKHESLVFQSEQGQGQQQPSQDTHGQQNFQHPQQQQQINQQPPQVNQQQQPQYNQQQFNQQQQPQFNQQQQVNQQQQPQFNQQQVNQQQQAQFNQQPPQVDQQQFNQQQVNQQQQQFNQQPLQVNQHQEQPHLSQGSPDGAQVQQNQLQDKQVHQEQ